MRNKIIIIRGFANISPEITSASFERINADNALAIMALKHPQHMPEPWNQFSCDITAMDCHVDKIMMHIQQERHEHSLLVEYAELALESGLESVRVIEGETLQADWFYGAVRTYHKSLGQTVCECQLEWHHKKHALVANIDGVKFYKRSDIIDRLGQSDIPD